MPIYEYKGFDRQGKAVKGIKEADGVKAIRAMLRRDGVLVSSVKESGSGAALQTAATGSFFEKIKGASIFQRGVKADDLALATRQLGTLLAAGVPLVESIAGLIDQVESPILRKVYSEVKADVNEGVSLGDALAKHKCFTNIYINMVRAGESSGALEVVLERLAEFLESQGQLRSKVIGAMVYPAVMMSVAAIVLIIMLTTVVPKITKVFENGKMELPLMTRVLIGTSSILGKFWWLLIIILISLIYGLRRYIKTPKGRARFDSLRLRAPVFGPIVQMIAVARFARTLSTLLSSGVPLLSSLQIVKNVVDNDAIEKAVDEVRDSVREGEDIAKPLKRTGLFPPMVVHMIAIGERSGQLESMLSRIATVYEQRVSVKVSTLTSLLEPIMILVMGGTVGFIVFAILTPILQMSQAVK